MTLKTQKLRTALIVCGLIPMGVCASARENHSQATADEPIDMTWRIVNPICDSMNGWANSRDNGNGTNWQFMGTTYTNGSASLSRFIERWTPWGTTLSDGIVSQTITGLDDGIYKVEVDVIATQQNTNGDNETGVFIFANADTDNSVEVSTHNERPEHYTLQAIVSGGTLTIGMKTSSTSANWIGMDNWTLTHTGLTDAQKKTAAYRLLNNEISASETRVAASGVANGQATYQNVLDNIRSRMQAGSYSTNDIPQVITEVKKATNQRLMADAVMAEGQTDVTHLLINADFVSPASEGWTMDAWGATTYACHEFWNTNFNFFQTLLGMPEGTYTLTTQGYYRSGFNEALQNPPLALNAKLFINDAETSIMSIVDEASAAQGKAGWWVDYKNGTQTPDNMEAAAYAFNNLNLYQPNESRNTVSLEVTNDGETLTLGVRKSELIAGDWVIFNNFHLLYTPNVMPGDVNGDKTLNVEDVIALVNFITNGGTINQRNADINSDGTITVEDVNALVGTINSANGGQAGIAIIQKGNDEEGPGVADVKRRF